MSRPVKRWTVRGGNSAFCVNGKFVSYDQSGCPRISLLRAHGIEEPVDDVRTQKTFNVGFLNEELFVKNYLPHIPHCVDFEIDEPVTAKINFEGHADVVTDALVFELKSVTSRNTWERVRKGKPKVSNVAQCVNYMLSRKATRGYLVYSLYAYCQGLELPDIFFEIELDSDGNIMLNGKQTGYHIDHIVEDRQQKARVLEDNVVYESRPVAEEGDKSPCQWCPFSTVCDWWDKTKNGKTEDFLKKAKEVTDATKTAQNLNRQRRLGEATEKFGTKVPEPRNPRRDNIECYGEGDF